MRQCGRPVRGRHIGEGDVVVAHAAQACQDLKGFASNGCHRMYGERLYLGKGGDDEVFTVPGGEDDEVGFGADVVDYIGVCVHFDQSQYDNAGDTVVATQEEEIF